MGLNHPPEMNSQEQHRVQVNTIPLLIPALRRAGREETLKAQVFPVLLSRGSPWHSWCSAQVSFGMWEMKQPLSLSIDHYLNSSGALTGC